MRVLVTGGAGYIGSVTARALGEDGHEVILLDRRRADHVAPVVGAEAVRGDVGDGELLASLFAARRFDAVVHLAADKSVEASLSDAGGYFSNNVGATLTLLRCMVEAGVDRFVFSSTCALYAPTERSAAHRGVRHRSAIAVWRVEADGRAAAAVVRPGARPSLGQPPLLQRRRSLDDARLGEDWNGRGQPRAARDASGGRAPGRSHRQRPRLPDPGRHRAPRLHPCRRRRRTPMSRRWPTSMAARPRRSSTWEPARPRRSSRSSTLSSVPADDPYRSRTVRAGLATCPPSGPTRRSRLASSGGGRRETSTTSLEAPGIGTRASGQHRQGRRAVSMAVAYVMSRFPRLTETFVVTEIRAVQDLGVTVRIYPLLRETTTMVQADAEELVAVAHYQPFLSTTILASNLRFLLRRAADLPPNTWRPRADDVAEPELSRRRVGDLPEDRPQRGRDAEGRRHARALPLREPSGRSRIP